MTDTGSKEKPPTDEAAEATVAETPAPEPWTARRVFEWNSYYDLYVAGFVLLLVFLGSANKIQAINSGLWSLLHAGRQTMATGAPVVTDVTSMAGEGRRWVNIPWLFELGHYALYSTVFDVFVPPAPPALELGATADAITSARAMAMARAEAAPKGDQYGAGSLIALDALARGLAALLLLGLRRKGPGLWWTSLCVAMALGVTLGPATYESIAPSAGGEVVRTVRPWVGVQIGGIATPASVVSPETWGLLFLSVELLLLHQAINLGKGGRLYALIPLFLLWANMDESFAFGLVALAASAIGLLADSKRDPSRPAPRPGLIVLGLSFAATFVNPSHAFGVLGAFGMILRSIGLEVGPPTGTAAFLFGSKFMPADYQGIAQSLRIYYAALVGLGLASFALNRANFVLGRFLTFVAASVLWALAFNYFTAPFALVLASTLALNGQEWYHRAFGTEGKLGAAWTVWSTGGRLVTIAVVFAAIARGVTGWGGQVGDAQFGFGFNPDDFPFEAADSLKDAPIEGSILNSSLAQGDAIAWRASPKRRAFVDSRPHLFPREVIEEWSQLRRDLRNDEVEKWRPVLDRYKISAVMIQLIGEPQNNAPRTYARLMNSPNWIPFYDDGAVVMFGRSDAKVPPADLAYFKANRLDADEIVYKRPRPVPSWERPPIATWEPLDRIFQNRLLNRTQPHVESAARWLSPANVPVDKPYLADPAHCLMAIREARIALSIKPDDSTAFQVLIEAYQRLLAQESALIAGITLTAENIPRIFQTPSQSRFLANRTRQLLAALNFRIQTLPPSKTADDRAIKANLTYALSRMYLQNGAYDMARDWLGRLAEDPQPGEMSEEFLKGLTKDLGDLNQRYDSIQAQMNDMVINRRATPLDKASFARSAGAPGLAINELEEVNDAGGNPAAVRPLLVDLYCDAGLPDKAFDVIGNLNIDDPSLSTGVGTASYRQGKVFFLLGNYENAVSLWRDKSIAQVRTQRSMQATAAGQILLGGDPTTSVRQFLEVPEKVETQAGWEFELAMAALEGGLPPDVAADHFQAALKLEPNLAVRPVIAYYLEKLGKPVPPPRAATPRAAEPTLTPTPAVETPKPAEASELPANPFAPATAKPPKP